MKGSRTVPRLLVPVLLAAIASMAVGCSAIYSARNSGRYESFVRDDRTQFFLGNDGSVVIRSTANLVERGRSTNRLERRMGGSYEHLATRDRYVRVTREQMEAFITAYRAGRYRHTVEAPAPHNLVWLGHMPFAEGRKGHGPFWTVYPADTDAPSAKGGDLPPEVFPVRYRASMDTRDPFPISRKMTDDFIAKGIWYKPPSPLPGYRKPGGDTTWYPFLVPFEFEGETVYLGTNGFLSKKYSTE